MSTGNTTYSMILAALLDTKRKAKDISQQDFFDATGLTSPTWSRLTRGKSHFQIEDLREACSFLNWSVSEITKEADEAERLIPEKADVKVISQKETKKNNDALAGMVAGAALGFLLTNLIKK